MIKYVDSTHSYFFDGYQVPSVTQILVEEGFINTTFFTEEGRQRGTGIHKAIADYARGAHCLLYEPYASYFSAYHNFEKDCNWIPHTVEEPMGNNQYAGTPDQIGHLNGKEAVLDIKTGVISRATGLQLSGYEILYGKKLKRYALQLTDAGRYILTEFSDRKDRYIFESAVAIWWFKKEMRAK